MSICLFFIAHRRLQKKTALVYLAMSQYIPRSITRALWRSRHEGNGTFVLGRIFVVRPMKFEMCEQEEIPLIPSSE